MLTREQEKHIYDLRHKSARQESGLCLVEGRKVIDAAGTAVRFTFTRDDTPRFDRIVTTETPQDIAGVAEIPRWSDEDLWAPRVVVVLDGLQDPGNVGAVLRLCLAFNASVLLVDSADPTGPKVVRASVGALFAVPWQTVSREHALERILQQDRQVVRLERAANGVESLPSLPCVLIAGSEGQGIRLPIKGTSLSVKHHPALESLNVGHALAIVLHAAFVR